MAEWISVKDRMPEKTGKYLICAIENGRFARVSTAYGSSHGFHLNGRMSYWKVTHWMPLPQPPEGIKFNEF